MSSEMRIRRWLMRKVLLFYNTCYEVCEWNFNCCKMLQLKNTIISSCVPQNKNCMLESIWNDDILRTKVKRHVKTNLQLVHATYVCLINRGTHHIVINCLTSFSECHSILNNPFYTRHVFSSYWNRIKSYAQNPPDI